MRAGADGLAQLLQVDEVVLQQLVRQQLCLLVREHDQRLDLGLLGVDAVSYHSERGEIN